MCPSSCGQDERHAQHLGRAPLEPPLGVGRARWGVGRRGCGALLRAIEAKQGTRTDRELRAGARPKFPRTRAARDAGMSDHQRKTALRVAAVPEEEFDGREIVTSVWPA